MSSWGSGFMRNTPIIVYLILGVGSIGFWIVIFTSLSIWVASLFGYVFIEDKYAIWVGVILFVLFFICIMYIKQIVSFFVKAFRWFGN